jgi:hypothetical protein
MANRILDIDQPSLILIKHVSRVTTNKYFLSTECKDKTSETEGLNLSFVVLRGFK